MFFLLIKVIPLCAPESGAIRISISDVENHRHSASPGDLNAARDVTNNGEFGKLFEIEDSIELAHILEELIENEEILKENYEKIQNYIKQNYLWRNLIVKLYNEIKERSSSK